MAPVEAERGLRLMSTRRVHIPARLWHKHGAVKAERTKGPRPPLDGEALERLALDYAGRYATSRAKLAAYLSRKLKERGWADEKAPPVDLLVERLAALRYVDDAAFATARAASLSRRGYGRRRIDQALRFAGIGEEERQAAETGDAFAAALRLARRKRIGPYAAETPDRKGADRAYAALIRAGHDPGVARRVMALPIGEIPECDFAGTDPERDIHG